MLTPRFRLSQTADHVTLVIHAPYCSVGDTELHADGDSILFVSTPYFLRLHLPGRVKSDDEAQGSYSCDDGDFTFVFEKDTPGENFENLDMITSLLAPRDIPDVNPTLVEALDEDGITFDEEGKSESEKSGENYSYGFANKISADFRDVGSEFPQIFELRIPERVSQDERHALRLQHENDKFSSDHYLADYFDEELIEPYLSYQNCWEGQSPAVSFTDDEVAILKELPNKSYLMTRKQYEECLMGLVDILYGFCYDKRTTLNDSNIESSWTVNRLSATLSWFCNFCDPRQTLVSSYRRALIYPIYRNFDLCLKVHTDLNALLKLGKKSVIKSMIEVHQMFNSSTDARYILNQLYMKDYLVFLQKCKECDFEDVAKRVAAVKIAKDCLDLDLEELENAAELVQKEEIGIVENVMAIKMASMSLLSGNKGCRPCLEELYESSSESSSDSSSDDSSSELDSDDQVS